MGRRGDWRAGRRQSENAGARRSEARWLGTESRTARDEAQSSVGVSEQCGACTCVCPCGTGPFNCVPVQKIMTKIPVQHDPVGAERISDDIGSVTVH